MSPDGPAITTTTAHAEWQSEWGVLPLHPTRASASRCRRTRARRLPKTPPRFRVRTLGSGAAMLKVDEGAGMQRAQAIGTGRQVGLHGALLAQRPQELALALA